MNNVGETKYSAWSNYTKASLAELNRLIHKEKIDCNNDYSLNVRLADLPVTLHLMEDIKSMSKHVPFNGKEVDMSENFVDFLRRVKDCDCHKCWLVDIMS